MAETNPVLKWVEPKPINTTDWNAAYSKDGAAQESPWQTRASGFGSRLAQVRAQFDPKAMGLPDGYNVTAVDSLLYNKDNAGKVRIQKQLGKNTYLNFDGTKGENDSLVLSKPWVSRDKSDMAQFAQLLSVAAMVVPGVGTALGKGLGFAGKVAPIVGNAALQGGISAIGSEGNLGATLKGAAVGAVGGATPLVVDTLAGAGLSPTAAGIIGKGAVGAGTAAIKGGNPIVGAVLGNVPGLNTGMGGLDRILNALLKDNLQRQLTPQKKP